MLAENSKDISNSLKKKFLFDNDINSIHLLINLYEADENIGNIFPKYISMSSLRKFVKRQIRGRDGNDLASRNIAELVHNDINRFELLLYLEGYKNGYKSSKYANTIEQIVLKNSNVESLYSKIQTKHTIAINNEIGELKNEIIYKLKNEIRTSESYKKLVLSYSRRTIKPKLYKLNHYLDKQVKMYEDSFGQTKLKYDSKPFNKYELSILYKKLIGIVFEDGIRTIIDSYWTGLIEQVLRRYK